MDGPGVADPQAAPEKRVVEVERGAFHDRPAPRVDGDSHPVGLDNVVVFTWRLLEGELVGEAGAAAGDDAQAQARARAPLLLGERRDLPGRLLGDGEWGARAIHTPEDSSAGRLFPSLLYHGARMYPSDLRERLRASLGPVPAPAAAPGDRLAGVLLPLVAGLEPSIVFTRRTEHLPRHAGEISFPGGIEHSGDFDLRATALREADEELGLPPGAVDVLGALPPVHTTVSGILVVPFVGMVGDRPVFSPSEGEIAEVLEFPVERLGEVEAEVEFPVGDHVYRGHVFDLDGHRIWGVTAHILHDFLDVVRGVA